MTNNEIDIEIEKINNTIKNICIISILIIVLSLTIALNNIK